MLRRALAAVVLATLLVPAATAGAPPTGFAFGRSGGSIIPFKVVISIDGKVGVTGPVMVGRKKLTARQLVDLNRIATVNDFAALPASTLCHGALPDIATSFVRVGGTTVHVHGGCSPHYQRVWKALVAAVHLAYG